MPVTVLVVLASLILLVWGWLQWHKGPWKILSEIDPDPKVEFDQLLFLDEERGYAFGHTMPDTGQDATERWRGVEAWVYTTTDGGVHWQTKKPLGSGYIFAVNKVPEGPIFLVQRFIGKVKGKEGEWQVSIRVSEDEGATWSKRDAGWDQIGWKFLDSSRGFCWGNGPWTTRTSLRGDQVGLVRDQPPILYYTENGSETWERIDVPPDVSFQTGPPAVHPGGSFFYLHENKLIHLTREPDRRWREEIEELPSSLTGSMLYADTYGKNRTVWIIANELPPPPPAPQDIAQAHLLRWDGPGKIEMVPGLSFPTGFMVDAMFVSESVITIVGANYSDTLASIFAPVAIYQSKNGGKSWRWEKPAMREQARPIAFWGPRHMWAMGMGNRLQHRE